MRRFGPEIDPTSQVPWIKIPVGTLCIWCHEPIAESDAGFELPCSSDVVFYHNACLLRTFVGSVAHQAGYCGCHIVGSTCRDPPDLTRREAAKEAAAYFLFTRTVGEGHA